MRPLFFDYPDQALLFDVADQFLLGPDLLVAPVTVMGARERSVVLPEGREWRLVWTGEIYPGGQTVTVPAPLAWSPVFAAADSDVMNVFDTQERR
jgi:alpha-D-xyloside xylohydrolase